MMQLALVPTFIIYTYDLHITKIYKYIIFIKKHIYNGKECIIIFKIILHVN